MTIETNLVVATGQSPSVDSEFILLSVVAAELQFPPHRLRQLSRRGKFPRMLEVTPRHYLVDRSQYEEWKAGRWTTNAAERAALTRAAVAGEIQNPRARRVGAR